MSASQRRQYTEVSQQLMESQNDKLAEDLNDRVLALKDLTIQIHSETREQRQMLDEMSLDFGRAGAMLSTTMKKLGDMMSTGGSRHMCYLALFAFFFFVVIYFMMKGKS